MAAQSASPLAAVCISRGISLGRADASCAPPAHPGRCALGARPTAVVLRSSRQGRTPGAASALALGASYSDDMVTYPGSKGGQRGGEPNVLKEVSIRIRELGRAGDAVAAVELLAELGQSGVQPDVMAVTATMKACLDANDLPRARKVFDEVVEGGAVPADELLFSVLLRAYGKRDPANWGEISSLLAKMRNAYGIKPGLTTYNTLLEVCANSNDYDRGCQLIDRMEEEGIFPDRFTIAAVDKRKTLRKYLKRLA